jgi:hypothetical protein
MVPWDPRDKDQPRDPFLLLHRARDGVDIFVGSELGGQKERYLFFVQESMALLGAFVGKVVAFEHKDVVDHELVVPTEFDVEDGSPENVVTRRAPETEEKKRRLPNNILDVLRLVVEGLAIDQHGSLGAVDMEENKQIALRDEIVHNKVPIRFEKLEVLVRANEGISKAV